jgi:hypothetical protein
MNLLYDPYHELVGSQILYWLDDLGALPLDEAPRDAEGFLFAGARPITDYRRLLAGRPLVRDRPEEREPLLRLDAVLQALGRADGRVLLEEGRPDLPGGDPGRAGGGGCRAAAGPRLGRHHPGLGVAGAGPGRRPGHARTSGRAGSPRLVVADFARGLDGRW